MTSPTFDTVKTAASGRWPEILAGLGIADNTLRNRHGPCPGCGGRDRFRFDDQEDGRFYCGGAGHPVSGDGFALLQHVHGWTAREALEHVAEAIGLHSCNVEPTKPQRAPRKAPEPSRTAIYAGELWLRSNKADTAVASHPNAIKKGVDWAAGAGRAIASGSVIGKNADCIVVPVRTLAGKLIAVQCINTEGTKQTFGALGADGCLLLGNTLDRSIPWAVVEGWADAVSFVFHVYQGNAVAACAFGKNSMDRIAEALANHYGPDRIYIMEDAA